MTIVLNTHRICKPSAGSYWRGAAEIFNTSGNTARLYVFATSPEDADGSAIDNDWVAVGDDLHFAVSTWQDHR